MLCSVFLKTQGAIFLKHWLCCMVKELNRTILYGFLPVKMMKQNRSTSHSNLQNLLAAMMVSSKIIDLWGCWNRFYSFQTKRNRVRKLSDAPHNEDIQLYICFKFTYIQAGGGQ